MHNIVWKGFQLPLNVFNRRLEELDDWATEPDLVSLVKERFPGDKRFDGHFRLLLEVPVSDDTGKLQFRVSWLNANNWNIDMNGTMPLEFIVDYQMKRKYKKRFASKNEPKLP